MWLCRWMEKISFKQIDINQMIWKEVKKSRYQYDHTLKAEWPDRGLEICCETYLRQKCLSTASSSSLQTVVTKKMPTV